MEVTKNGSPAIAVIMGIYNCAPTLLEALESLKSQTFKDVGIVMCDDGSVDNTLSLAISFQKDNHNVIVLENTQNMGLNYTLNKCLSTVYERWGDVQYIARMDGDDISKPERLEKEYKFLEAHPEYEFVSCPMYYFDSDGVFKTGHECGEPALSDFVKSSPFCHAPVLIRTEAYKKVGGYTQSPRLLRVEDYHLWYKLYLQGCHGYRLPEPLYMMRDDRNAISRRTLKSRFNESYVKYLIVRDFKLPIWNYAYCLKPIIAGLLPRFLYEFFHKKKH